MNKVKFLFYALLGYGLSLGPGLAADDVPECGWDPPVLKYSQQSLTVVTEDGQRLTRQYEVQEASCERLGSDKCGKGEKFAGFSGSFTEDGTVTIAYPKCCEKDEIIKFDKDDKSGFWTCRNSLGRLTVTAHSGILCCPKTCPEDDPKEQKEIADRISRMSKCQKGTQYTGPLVEIDYDQCGCKVTTVYDPCDPGDHDSDIRYFCTDEGCKSEQDCRPANEYEEYCGCSSSSESECGDGTYLGCYGCCYTRKPNTFLGDC